MPDKTYSSLNGRSAGDSIPCPGSITMPTIMQQTIGNTAGQIWEYVHANGATSAIKLKSALSISNTLMFLALGWLAREDKIDMVEEEHSFIISLKIV